MKHTGDISLKEFQRVTGISDRALVWLLHHNSLPLSVSEKGITVQGDKLEIDRIIDAIVAKREGVRNNEKALLVERAASTICSKLDELLAEAISELPKQE